MNTAPKSTKRSGLAVALFVVPLLLVGYFLSYGPATRLLQNGQLSFSTWRTSFHPLILVAARLTLANNLQSWYTGIWGAKVTVFSETDIAIEGKVYCVSEETNL